MSKLILVLLLSSVGWAQMVTFGVKGGVAAGTPTADYGILKIDPGYWTVGPTVEFHTRIRLSLELAGLYSSYTVGYPTIQTPPFPLFRYTSVQQTHAWDIPAVLKYRFSEGTVRPFVFAGVNYRRENSHVSGFCETGVCTVVNTYSTSQDRIGPTAGAGIEWKPGRIRIAPEFRYTHLNRPGANQFSVLLGVSF